MEDGQLASAPKASPKKKMRVALQREAPVAERAQARMWKKDGAYGVVDFITTTVPEMCMNTPVSEAFFTATCCQNRSPHVYEHSRCGAFFCHELFAATVPNTFSLPSTYCQTCSRRVYEHSRFGVFPSHQRIATTVQSLWTLPFRSDNVCKHVSEHLRFGVFPYNQSTHCHSCKK